MNKYLTILLVVLTATGSEAQALTSALQLPCGNMKYELMLTPEQLRAMGSDIMSVLKVLQGTTDNDKSHPFYNHNFISASLNANENSPLLIAEGNWAKPKITRSTFVGSSVSIRAPSL